jgi:hypothetical protein
VGDSPRPVGRLVILCSRRLHNAHHKEELLFSGWYGIDSARVLGASGIGSNVFRHPTPPLAGGGRTALHGAAPYAQALGVAQTGLSELRARGRPGLVAAWGTHLEWVVKQPPVSGLCRRPAPRLAASRPGTLPARTLGVLPPPRPGAHHSTLVAGALGVAWVVKQRQMCCAGRLAPSPSSRVILSFFNMFKEVSLVYCNTGKYSYICLF